MFINAFLMIGANNLINPIANPINAIAKSTAAKIVNASILLNFNVNNCFFFDDDQGTLDFVLS